MGYFIILLLRSAFPKRRSRTGAKKGGPGQAGALRVGEEGSIARGREERASKVATMPEGRFRAGRGRGYYHRLFFSQDMMGSDAMPEGDMYGGRTQ